jgi:ferredoxin/flavodoxin
MIICFSGTGNSRYVAKLLADRLNDHVTEINSATALNLGRGGERVVWVFPVYSWGVPAIVRSFMERVEIAGGVHYLVMTCGDDTGLTQEQWRRLATRRGWTTAGAWSVQMPNTYVLLPGFNTDSEAVARDKMASVPERVEQVASGIAAEATGDDVVKGRFAWFKTRVLYPLFMRWLTSPKPFHATEDCVGCGKCEAVCPLRNIRDSRSKQPQWGDRCTLCLGCYHVCPRHAVAYGKITADKGQYFNQAVK